MFAESGAANSLILQASARPTPDHGAVSEAVPVAVFGDPLQSIFDWAARHPDVTLWIPSTIEATRPIGDTP
jgi:hypothetical protein